MSDSLNAEVGMRNVEKLIWRIGLRCAELAGPAVRNHPRPRRRCNSFDFEDEDEDDDEDD